MTLRRTDSFEVASQNEVEERRGGLKKEEGIERKKWQNSTGLSSCLQGFWSNPSISPVQLDENLKTQPKDWHLKKNKPKL